MASCCWTQLLRGISICACISTRVAISFTVHCAASLACAGNEARSAWESETGGRQWTTVHPGVRRRGTERAAWGASHRIENHWAAALHQPKAKEQECPVLGGRERRQLPLGEGVDRQHPRLERLEFRCGVGVDGRA
eukprot:4309119-Prymnesium_polylepis.1